MTPQTALAPREPHNQITTGKAQDIDIFRLGAAFAKSGYFQDARDEAQAVVKIIYGQELGISPAASMSGIHIISGKPVLSATALAGLIKSRRPLYDYRVVILDDDGCELEFFESGKSVGKSSFTMTDAKNAELVGGKNPNWKKYPKNMLFARAISNGARLYCPDIFTGSPIYVPDELDKEVNADGDIILDRTDNYQSAKTVQPIPPKSSAGVLKNRALILDLLESVGVNPQRSLSKYDTLKTDAERLDALEKVRQLVAGTKARESLQMPKIEVPEGELRANKIAEIERAVSSDSWSLTEAGTAEFFAKYTGGEIIALTDASDDELSAIIAELVELGLAAI